MWGNVSVLLSLPTDEKLISSFNPLSSVIAHFPQALNGNPISVLTSSYFPASSSREQCNLNDKQGKSLNRNHDEDS
jgi:hypothetical protein